MKWVKVALYTLWLAFVGLCLVVQWYEIANLSHQRRIYDGQNKTADF